MTAFDPWRLANPATKQVGPTDRTGYVSDGSCALAQEAQHPDPSAEVRLDLGRNPDGCAPEVATQIKRWLSSVDAADYLSRYPSRENHPLKEKIADLHRIAADQVILSAGVEQMVEQVAQAFLSPGDRVAVFQPSFFVFRAFSERVGARVVAVELDPEAGWDWSGRTLDRLDAILTRSRPKVVWLANPNNPTGRLMPAEALERVLAMAGQIGSLVVVDEAYGEYCDPDRGVRSATRFLADQPQAIVCRSFSKAYGLASMRIGWAASAQPDVLEALRVQAPNFPIAQLSLDAAAVAMDHPGHLRRTRLATQRRMQELMTDLGAQPHLEALDSDCILLTFRHVNLEAQHLHEALLARGVRTAHLPGQTRFARTYLRVALGRRRANLRLVDALADLSAAPPAERDGS